MSDVGCFVASFFLATSAGGTNTGIRSNNGMAMGASPYMVQTEHHHQSLGPAFSLQPYAAYPHGVIYAAVTGFEWINWGPNVIDYTTRRH